MPRLTSRGARRAPQLEAEAPAAPALTVVPDAPPEPPPPVVEAVPELTERTFELDGTRHENEVIVDGQRAYAPVQLTWSSSSTTNPSVTAYMSLGGEQIPVHSFRLSQTDDWIDATALGGVSLTLPGYITNTLRVTTTAGTFAPYATYGSGATLGYDIVYNPRVHGEFRIPTPETPEQIIEREAATARRREEYQRQRQADHAARTAAHARARETLLIFLDPEQRVEYETTGRFTVIGSHGNRYRIGPGSAGNVEWIDEAGSMLGRLCAHPSMRDEWLPDQDVALAQMMALMTDETNFVKIANVHTGRRPTFPAGRAGLVQAARSLIAA